MFNESRTIHSDDRVTTQHIVFFVRAEICENHGLNPWQEWGGVGRDHLSGLLSFKSFQNAINVEAVKRTDF